MSVVDTASLSVVATVQVGVSPADLVLALDGRLADVSSPGGDTVSVLDVGSARVVGTIPVAGRPGQLDLSVDGATLHVDTAEDVVLVDTASTREVARYPLTVPVTFGAGDGFAVTPQGTVYVADGRAVDAVALPPR